jgi:predicted DNA-binding protein
MGASVNDRRNAQLTVRMSARVLRRVDRLAGHVGKRLGMPATGATRADVLREALLRGLEILEAAEESGPPESAPGE